MEKLIKQASAGQSLVDMVVTVAIASLVIVALVFGAVIGLRNVQFSRNQSRAMELNREASEWLRSENKRSWSQLWRWGSETGSVYCFTGLDFSRNRNCNSSESDLIEAKFSRQVILTQAREGETNRLEIIIATSWQDPSGLHSETITTFLTKY